LGDEADHAVGHILKISEILRALGIHSVTVNLAFHNDVVRLTVEDLDIGSSLWSEMLYLNLCREVVFVCILHSNSDLVEKCEQSFSVLDQDIGECLGQGLLVVAKQVKLADV